ncbi:insulinase family protein, partial [bacterium]|nr:insulinase family protein [bacterium]
FSERLRIVIREDLGATYSPYAYNDPSKIFKNYGILHVVAKVKPEKHLLVYNKIKDIVDSFLVDGITKKETDLALKPLLKHLKVIRKTNRYWLNSVMANASNYPEKFDWANTIINDYQTITRDDLMLLAKKYLRIDDSALIVIKPVNITE